MSCRQFCRSADVLVKRYELSVPSLRDRMARNFEIEVPKPLISHVDPLSHEIPSKISRTKRIKADYNAG
jgi:hypothetical protein